VDTAKMFCEAPNKTRASLSMDEAQWELGTIKKQLMFSKGPAKHKDGPLSL